MLYAGTLVSPAAPGHPGGDLQSAGWKARTVNPSPDLSRGKSEWQQSLEQSVDL